MEITIKVLQGQECKMQVTGEMNVLELKQLVSKRLKIPSNQIKFLLTGKTLADSKCLQDYNVKDGSKLIVVVCRTDDNAVDINSLRAATCRLLCRFYNEADTRKIADEFIKGFHRNVNSLSLDDLERIASSHLEKNK